MTKKTNAIKRFSNSAISALLLSSLMLVGCSTDREELDNTLQSEGTNNRTTPVVGGTYTLLNVSRNRTLEIENGSNADGANAQVNGTDVNTSVTHRQWEVLSVGDDFIRLRNVDSRRSLEIENGSNSNGANAQQIAYNQQTHQEWEILSVGDNIFRLRNRDSRKTLRALSNFNVDQVSYNRNDDQHWIFTEVGSEEDSGNSGSSGNENSENLALGQSTSQSSTSFGGNSARAVDGDTNGRYRDQSVTHTSPGDNQWWQVELESNTNINQIVVWNRTDNCCVFRLGDFTVNVINSNGNTVYSQRITSAPTPSVTLNTGGVIGNRVRIEQNLSQALSLAEVQIFGSSSTDSQPNPTEGNGDFDLDPNLEPWENFDLSTWALDSPAIRPSDECRAVRISENSYDDIPGSDTRPYFFTHTDGGMRFVSPVGGATTNTRCDRGFPRSELRENLRAGNTSISERGDNANNWALGYQPSNSGHGGRNGVLTATLRINQVTTTGDGLHPGRTIIGQIHASDDEPARLYYRKCPDAEFGSIYVEHEVDGSDRTFNMIGSERCDGNGPSNGIRLNELFSYEIINDGALIIINIIRGDEDGEVIATETIDMNEEDSGYDVRDEWMYFKAGAYTQNNTGDPDDTDIITFYRLSNSHDSN